MPLAIGGLLGALLRRIFPRRSALVILLALLPPGAALVEFGVTSPNEAETVVATEERIDAPRELVWKSLVFFEETSDDLPWFFRLGLPRPLGASPSGGADGDEQVCVYTTGHVKKRVVERAEARRLEFVVTEQAVGFEHDVRLRGGAFDLTDDGVGGTRLRLTTRYVGIPRPAFVWRTVEGWALTALHRHVIDAVRERCERASSRAALPPPR